MPVRLIVPKISFRDKVLITGFHGIGATGYIAISHMIKALKAERIGYIDTERLPPFISIEDGRLLTPFEVYGWERMVLIGLSFLPG